MELWISMFGDLSFDRETGKFTDPGKRLKEMVEEIKLADEVGLDIFGLGEHHRPDYAISAPEIILAATAPVTKHIKLSSAVTVLSSTDPIRVYQQFSSLDLLTDGRAEVTVGRGSFTESFPLFGYSLDDYEELFIEKLKLLLQINNSQWPLDWKGKFRAPMQNQEVFPKPTKPLDIWIAVGWTPESVVRAAHLGLPLVVAIIGGLPARFAPYFDLYREEYIAAWHDPANIRLATHSHGIVGDDGDEMEEKYYPIYAEQMDRIGRTRGWSHYTHEQFRGGRRPEWALFVGDPSMVIDKILLHQKLFWLSRFVMHMDIGAPSHMDIMHSIELLWTKVLPGVRKGLQS